MNFKQGIRNKTRQISWCITLSVLSWQTSENAFVLLTQRTMHPSHTGSREKRPAKIWWTWRVTGFTDHVWQWQNQGTTKQLYFFFSSRAKGLLFWNRKQTLFSISDVNKLQWSYATKRKKCPVDKILDSTCPGKQLTTIYLHLISHGTSNSSFYAYLCKTAVVVSYLYKSLSSTGEEHRAEPLASSQLAALHCPTRSPQSRAGSGQRDGHQRLPNECWVLLSAFSHLLHKAKQLERTHGAVLSYACSSDVAAEWLRC